MRSILLCLLIDDDPDDHEIFKMALSEISERIACKTATDGEDGLQTLHKGEENPDYIFLDLNMPRMDGKECLREIRKVDRYKDVPVIIYSTSIALSDMAETKKLSANGYIVKQPRLELLVKKLKEVFTANGHGDFLD